ncbi:hypothetical protein PROFUN_11678 [Planoprotostelium fungivorum]|uniref:PH domain-containing protein n=1 Tax=Planoprotostelium fungivorum TaxID=1890364 RepID=A0A2P6N5A0_9EUKA|nr:hypothetical protein PROFUN_11678 [Planoprotostelium fungivorum]
MAPNACRLTFDSNRTCAILSYRVGRVSLTPSLLLFACLLAVASARPAAFRNAVPVDGTGTRRLVEDIDDHIVSRSVKFSPQLVLLDEVDELLSLTCYGSDRFVLVFNDSVPSWTDNFPVLGGTEWGCVDDEGKATSPALYVLDVTTEGNTVELRGRRPELNEVYESFRIDLSRSEDRKRAATRFNAGNYNYDTNSGRAQSVIPIFNQDCQTSKDELSSTAQEFCQLKGKLSNTAECSNCFAFNDMEISASYTPWDGATFSASGSLTLHAEFGLNVSAEIVREYTVMSTSLPLTHVPSFGAISLGGFFDIEVVATVGWRNQGSLSSGVDMKLDYSMAYGSEPQANHNLQMIKPTGTQGGDATFRLNFSVGPAFRLTAGNIQVVNASVKFNPHIQVEASFAVPQPFPAQLSVPTAADSVLYNPSLVSACYGNHYLKFRIPFGYQTRFTLKVLSLKEKSWPLQEYESPKPLAQGCLLSASSSVLKQVQFLFDGAVARFGASQQTHVNLFLQDLSTRLNGQLTASVTISSSINKDGQYVVNVTLPQGPDFANTDNQYAQLSQLSRDPSSLRTNDRSSQISHYLVANVPPSTTSTSSVASPITTTSDGADSLSASSLAAVHSIPLAALVAASTLTILFDCVTDVHVELSRAIQYNTVMLLPRHSFTVYCTAIMAAGFNISEWDLRYYAWVIAAFFVLGACITSFIVIWQHIRNYTMPSIQKAAIRIVLMIPIFAVESFFSLVFKDLSFYFTLMRDTYEAYVLYMFFRLLIELAEGEESLIAKLEEEPEMKYLMPFCCWHIKPGRIFLHRCKQFILQYVVVKLILTLVTFICELTDTYEEGSFTPKRAYLYVTIVYNISISISLYFLVLFYESIKNILSPYKPLSKFLCIKSIVFFTFWQGLAISFMVYFNFGIEIDDYTVSDVATALQSFLICIEMFPLAIGHAHTFGHKAFQNVQVKQVTDSDTIHVLLDTFSLHDVVVDFFAALKKGPKRNINVGDFLFITKEEQLNRVIKQEWLRKRGEDLVKKWKRRYFMLISEPLGLVFFKYNPFLRHDNDSSRLKARGFIALKEVTAIVEQGKRGPGEFIIVTGRRKWHVKAESLEEKDDWVATIRNHIPQKQIVEEPVEEHAVVPIDTQRFETEIYQLTHRLHEAEDAMSSQRARIMYLEMLLSKAGHIVPADTPPQIRRMMSKSSLSSPRISRSTPSSPIVQKSEDVDRDEEIRIQVDEEYEPRNKDEEENLT